MWKSIKDIAPKGNINILITDGNGGFCIVRTENSGALPPHRYMMKTKDDHYYTAKGSITGWIEISALRLILCSDKIKSP